jgi:hypothetical protein
VHTTLITVHSRQEFSVLLSHSSFDTVDHMAARTPAHTVATIVADAAATLLLTLLLLLLLALLQSERVHTRFRCVPMLATAV